ncbi:MAG: adenylate/guanylate cyclase domain-containing protein [Burkholderiaceae bacterium]|jgi:class 3 adenylate cyclase/tetratricopeptide (TPR) repeat protein
MNAETRAFSSYVPRLISKRLASGAAFHAPEAEIVSAAVLVSDIQGFTSLVRAFTEAGRSGLEELTWVLNGYFADLVEEIYAHGGDVLCIAGDGFLCYWPVVAPFDLAQTTLRAAQAGFAIQARLHDRNAGHNQRFATRIGVSAGDVSIAFVGGVGGRWELVADGQTLREAAEAELACPPGKVVLSTSAWEMVARSCEGSPLDEIGVMLSAIPEQLPPVIEPESQIPDLDERLLLPFLQPSVLDSPDSEGGWLAQQRGVTVLMADLPGLGDAGVQDLERTHASVRAFQQVVERFEGTVRVDVDDKGVSVLAVFGLPPRAHENDALRAIHAARALREALDALDVRCGIGVATGRAFCGTFGSDLRRDYMLRGAVVNLAARLMRVAGSLVLCDRATTLAVRGRISFEAVGALELKGHVGLVQTYRPLGSSDQNQGANRPLIGRQRERSVLAKQLQMLLDGGQGGLVVLEAEAGLGKSRLMADLNRSADLSGVRVLIATADAIESNTAYFAWRPVLRRIFGVDATLDLASARERVIEKMAGLPELARLLPLLNVVLPVQIPENELTQEMIGDVRAENTRQLLAKILENEVKTLPTLLEVEDAHWLDSNSFALLLEVVQSVHPLVTVVATRPYAEPVPAEYERLKLLAGANILTLEGLPQEDMATLMCQYLGVREVPGPLFELVQDRVAGHPFFCEEVLQTMLEADAIRVGEGQCHVGDLGALDLPSSVEGVILSRLDRLPPGQQICLKVAAVIGRAFEQRTLQDTHPIETERVEVPRHLVALTSISLTAPETPPPEPSYLFKHAITRDVTYELMPLAQREPLHRAVAQWYERTYADDLEPHSALLAYHWMRAANPERTALYLERAGQQMLRSGAFAEAKLFYSQVLELDRAGGVQPDNQRRALWQKGVGAAHYFLGDLQESRVHMENAVALLDRPVPTGKVALFMAVLANVCQQVLHRRFPERYLGRKQATREAFDEVAECYRTLSQIYYLDGEPAVQLVYVTVRGANVGELAGPSPALARNLSNMGTLCGLGGQQKWADWYAQRAVEMAEKEGQYAAAAYVWSINSLTKAQCGNWKAAKEANAEALRRVQQLADYNVEAEIWVIRSTVNLCEGDFAAAPEAWQRARALAKRNNNAQILCWSLLDEVDTLLGRGDIENAARVLDSALAVPTALSDGSSTIDKQRAIAMTRLRQGRYADAFNAAKVVLDMVTEKAPTGYHWVDCCASAVEVFLEALENRSVDVAARRDELELLAERGCKALSRLSGVFGNVRPRSWLLRGRLHKLRGQNAQARAALHKARSIAIEMDMPFEKARALLEIARLETGPTGVPLLAEAAVIFQGLGADYFSGLVKAARIA